MTIFIKAVMHMKTVHKLERRGGGGKGDIDVNIGCRINSRAGCQNTPRSPTEEKQKTRQMTLLLRRTNFVYHFNFAFVLLSYCTILRPCLHNISKPRLDDSVSQAR